MSPASNTLTNCVTAGIWCATELYISKCKKRIISSVSVCAGDNMLEATDLCLGLISVLACLYLCLCLCVCHWSMLVFL